MVKGESMKPVKGNGTTSPAYGQRMAPVKGAKMVPSKGKKKASASGKGGD